MLWSGFEQLTARLDTTEDAVEGALGSLSTAVDELKTQLAALLKKEQAKDVEPQRWAARATTQDWDQLIDWVDQLQHRLLTAQRLRHPTVLARPPRRRRRTRRPVPILAPAISNDQTPRRTAATTSPPGTTAGCGHACAG